MGLPDTYHRHRRLLWGVVILSVGLRVGASLYMGDQVQALPGIDDQITYDRLAQNVLGGNGFSLDADWWPDTRAGEPTAHWSYFTTLYLAGVYAVVGHHPLAARLIQAAVTGVLMPLLTYRLARRAFGSRVGLVAAAISAVYVYFFYFAAALTTEAFLLVATLWTFDLADMIRLRARFEGDGLAGRTGVAQRAHLDPLYLWLGLALAISMLLRQTFLVAIVLIYLWLWWATPDRREGTWRGLLVATVLVVLLLAPWTVRNYLAFGEFVLLNTNGGYALFWGTHPAHGASFSGFLPNGTRYRDFVPPALRGLNEAAKEKALTTAALGFVFDDPARYLLLCVSRLSDQFWFWPSAASSLLSNVSRVGSFGLFLPFMLYGSWLAMREWRSQGLGSFLVVPTALWLVFCLVYNGIYVAVWGSPRYRLPTDTVMVIFAGLALVRLGENGAGWFRRRSLT